MTEGYTPPAMAPGYAHAYETYRARGKGMVKKDGKPYVFRAGPMAGMTEAEMQADFDAKWRVASPYWKDEYSRRATEAKLAPREKTSNAPSPVEVAPPSRASRTDISSESPILTVDRRKDGKSVVSYQGVPREESNVSTTVKAPTDVSPPVKSESVVSPVRVPPASMVEGQKRNAASVARTVQATKGRVLPPTSPAGRFDLMKADYQSLTREQKDERTRRNIERASGGTQYVTASRIAPTETKWDGQAGRIVKTNEGEADAGYAAYDAAQNRVKADGGSAEDRQTVKDYFNSRNVGGESPEQVAKRRDDERKGYYQAGRYVGPDRTASRVTVPRKPYIVEYNGATGEARYNNTEGGVRQPVYRPRRALDPQGATSQPVFGQRAGTGVTRRPV